VDVLTGVPHVPGRPHEVAVRQRLRRRPEVVERLVVERTDLGQLVLLHHRQSVLLDGVDQHHVPGQQLAALGGVAVLVDQHLMAVEQDRVRDLLDRVAPRPHVAFRHRRLGDEHRS